MVELLVSLSVIAVLISIAFPALRQAHKSGTAIQCLTTVRGVLVGHRLWSAGHGGRWLTLAVTQSDRIHFPMHAGDTTYNVEGIDLMYIWPVVIRDYVDGAAESGVPISCPEVRRARPFLMDDRVHAHALALESYWYSPTLCTESRLWDNADPGRMAIRRRPNDHIAAVLLSDVLFPSRKVAMFEHHDHHGDGSTITPETPTPVSLGFADGHADRRVVADAAEPVAGVTWPFELSETHDGEAIPFAATPLGFQGQDY